MKNIKICFLKISEILMTVPTDLLIAFGVTRTVEGARNGEETVRNKESFRAPEARILIVDDDPDYAKIVKEWIKDDFKVDIVTAGVQAINFLMKLPPNDQVDLILLDYEMPVVDGPQVLQMLRSDEVTEKIPVVFLTGVGDKESVIRVMSLKPDGYLLKSTSKDGLLKFLKNKLSIQEY